MRDTLAMILAGGVGSRLNVLVRYRAKPAVAFGGIYRIIDFALSNVMNSGLNQVAVLTQYKPLSLMGHIGTGVAWDFTGRTLYPTKTETNSSAITTLSLCFSYAGQHSELSFILTYCYC